MNRRSFLAGVGATFANAVLLTAAAQDLTKEQAETFSGAQGLVFRRLDVQISGRPYAYEDTEQHAVLDWYGVVYSEEATSRAAFDSWGKKIGGFESPNATWLFPEVEYDDAGVDHIPGPRVLSGEYLYGEWGLRAGTYKGVVGDIFLAQKGRILLAGLVTPKEDSEDVHIPLTAKFLSETCCDQVLSDSSIPATGEAVSQGLLLSCAPSPALIAEAEDIDGCTEIETWTKQF